MARRGAAAASAPAVAEGTPDAPAAARSGFLQSFRSLKNHNFRWYWFSGLGMAGAQGITQFAVTWLVLDLTGSVASLGLVILAQGFPMTIVSLFGGVLADRYDRRKLLIGAQAVSMLTIFTLAMLTIFGLVQLWLVFANSIIFGFAWALTGPARQAFISTLVPPEERINAIALNSVQQHASRIVWPSVAAALIAFLGVGAALVVDAACFLAGILCLLMIRGVVSEPVSRRFSPVQQVIEGMAYTKATPGVSLVIGLTLAFGAFSLAFIQMAPGYARTALDYGPGETGLFLLCLALGALGGAAILTTIKVKDQVRFSVLGMMGYAATLVLFYLNPWPEATYLIAILNGVANTMQVIMPNALFQTVVPSQYLGRVISLWFLAAGLAALSALPLGIIGDAYGLRFAFACSGAIFLVIATWFAFISPRLRNLRAVMRPA